MLLDHYFMWYHGFLLLLALSCLGWGWWTFRQAEELRSTRAIGSGFLALFGVMLLLLQLFILPWHWLLLPQQQESPSLGEEELSALLGPLENTAAVPLEMPETDMKSEQTGASSAVNVAAIAAEIHDKAWRYYDRQRMAEALLLAEYAIKLMPDSADFHDTLALFLFEAKAYDDAINMMQKACRLAPNNQDYAEKLKRYEAVKVTP